MSDLKIDPEDENVGDDVPEGDDTPDGEVGAGEPVDIPVAGDGQPDIEDEDDDEA